MSTKTLVVLSVIVALLGVGFYILVMVPSGTISPYPEPSPTYCTMDARECPDGSYVGRTGPNCEFAACPNTPLPVATTTGRGNKVELVGQVTLSPICPVERVPPDPKCAPRPFKTIVEVRESGRVSLLASTETDSLGGFRFLLAPGTYDVIALGKNPLPRCEAKTIVVSSEASSLDLSCDTGIR